MSDDLKEAVALFLVFDLGMKPSDFWKRNVTHNLPWFTFLSWFGSISCYVVKVMGMQQGWALFYGGTSSTHYGRSSYRYDSTSQFIFIESSL